MNLLTIRQFYALIWKDWVIHKRHYVWTALEMSIPVLVCVMAIISNTHQGKPKLESERTFEADDFDKIYGDLNSTRCRLLIAPNNSFTRALVQHVDDGALRIEIVDNEQQLVSLIKEEIPISLDQVKRLIPDDTANVTVGGVVIDFDDHSYLNQSSSSSMNNNLRTTFPSTRIFDSNKHRARSVYTSHNSQPKDSNNGDLDDSFIIIDKSDNNKPLRVPINLKLSVTAKDFRLPWDPFPKKFSLGPYLHSDHYLTSFFIASQLMLSRAYMNLLAEGLQVNLTDNNPDIKLVNMVPSNEDIIGQRMPYPKYVAHKRLKETTLSTFVAGSQKQKPFVLTMDYCITIGFLVSAIFLAKRIVDEKRSRVRDMLRLVGVSDWTYYTSHLTNTMIVMGIQSVFITFIFTGHEDAPGQNISPTLLFAILLIYCLASVTFVLALSTLFTSSTKAIIFTSLLWLGLPEAIDRIFKMDAGVIESNGFLPVREQLHLGFCMIPNFALRLMNRLLTECDIYGEFYAKKELYGEYRAIWDNIFHVLPLYRFITVGEIMLTILVSVVFYATLIYLVNLMNHSATNPLTGSGDDGSSGKDSSLTKSLCTLIFYPFKLIFNIFTCCLFVSSKSKSSAIVETSYNNRDQLSNNSHHTNLTNRGNVNGAFIKSQNGSCESFTDKGYQVNLEMDDYYKNRKHQLAQSGLPPSRDNDELTKYFELAPKMFNVGVSIRDLCKTYITGSSILKMIEAVKNVSLDMYYSQILVLLGHNGAGKTTLIDIISGHNRKTSGHIIIDGYDIDTNPDQARRRVGFCPQFDVLFERLTVEEHLYFYGIIKGARKELAAEILQLLQQSDLIEHRKKLSKTLSGGYKRKLSLAIAMIAGSKVLILDEPTSGMDPESRRKVWDFLQLIRRDRLILMTTHHMEEADALGDRIAVMSAGQVKCCGSSLFLKKVFNAGYHLRISKSATNWNQVGFDEIIGAKYNLHAKLENCTPHELMYQFDADETEKVLPKLFEDLELNKERVGIFGFGVTVSTMDDVFMKIGMHFKDVEAEEMQMRFNLANNKVSDLAQAINTRHGKVAAYYRQNTIKEMRENGVPSKLNGVQPVKPHSQNRYPRIIGQKLFRQHMKALIAKRYNHARKNWFQIVWIFFISLFCIVSIILLLDFIIFREEVTPEWRRPVTLNGMGYGSRTEGVYQFSSPEDPTDDVYPFVSSTTTSPTVIPASVSTVSNSGEEDSTSLGLPGGTTDDLHPFVNSATTWSTITPASASIASNSEAATATSSGLPSDESTPATIIDGSTGEPLPSASRLVADVVSSPDPPTALNSSAIFLNRYWGPEAIRGGVANILNYTDINTEMIDMLTRQFADFREHYIVGGEKKGKKYMAWYNGEATHSLPISMNMMMNSILRQFTDLIEGDHPIKRSRISLTHHALSQINTLIAFLPHLGRLINLVFLPFSLAFITSYFVIFPTHERVTKSKHLQLMTGLSCRTFWLSHFLFDLLIYSTYTVLMLVIYYVWDRLLNDHKIYFANFEHSLALVLLVFLFVFAALPFAYIFSFLAKKPTSAFSSLCVLTILTGTATLTLISLYELKYEDQASTSIKTLFTIFLWSSRLIPSVSLLVGLQKLFSLNTTRHICINISTEVLDLLCKYIHSPLVDEELKVLRPERCCKQVCGDSCYDQWPFFWSGWFGINAELSMLVLDAILLWSLLVLIEYKSLRRQIWSLISRSLSFRRHLFSANFRWKIPRFVDNKELHKEQRRIDKAIQDGKIDQYAMVVSNLTKVYSNDFTAVDQLSFIVDKQEFFGLLGVNGAGKSTTFKMLTGELEATSGTAWIGSHDVEQSRKKYLKQIGYCPQMDALIDNMTGNEMLTLFARLRGVPEHYIEDLVEDTIDKLGLTRMATINCNNYSGGNKRRLSVGLALIGAPEVIFLDEPTSGVDPRSRRRLWSTLIEFQQLTRSAIVMTSHSMNECESLCDRVAIMVAGQFQVLGSIQYLRTKLSQGFSLILKLKSETLNNHIDQLQTITNHIHNYMINVFGSDSISLKDIHQTMISYHVAPDANLTWSKMLVNLEKAKRDLDLEDYQITSDASLESIFLSLAKKQTSPTTTTNNNTRNHQSVMMI